VIAYCFASGQIGFAADVPKGALPFLRGRDRDLRAFICGVARHAYDGETLLVPGVPEAPNQNVALDELHAWMQWIAPHARKRGLTTIGGLT
jgi:hypothetical protein